MSNLHYNPLIPTPFDKYMGETKCIYHIADSVSRQFEPSKIQTELIDPINLSFLVFRELKYIKSYNPSFINRLSDYISHDSLLGRYLKDSHKTRVKLNEVLDTCLAMQTLEILADPSDPEYNGVYAFIDHTQIEQKNQNGLTIGIINLGKAFFEKPKERFCTICHELMHIGSKSIIDDLGIKFQPIPKGTNSITLNLLEIAFFNDNSIELSSLGVDYAYLQSLKICPNNITNDDIELLQSRLPYKRSAIEALAKNPTSRQNAESYTLFLQQLFKNFANSKDKDRDRYKVKLYEKYNHLID